MRNNLPFTVKITLEDVLSWFTKEHRSIVVHLQKSMSLARSNDQLYRQR
jgi:hypothetical protein